MQLSTTTDKKKTNDNSNPQQGTSSTQQHSTLAQSGEKDRTAVVSPPTSTGNFKSHSKINPSKRDSRKLFVGGLPSEVTNEDFKKHFSQYGSIIDSIVMINRETGFSRRFGFVTFEDPAVATALIENNVQPGGSKSKVLIAGKMCEVKASEPKTAHSANNGDNYGRSGRGRGRYYLSSPNGSEKNLSTTSSADAARTVSTLTGSASTKTTQQEQFHHGSTHANANAIEADFDETEQGNHSPPCYEDDNIYYDPSYVDHNYYYDQYGYPQNPNAYYYPQYLPNNVPPQMGNPFQYPYHPSQGAPVPPVPPGPPFYNNQNAMMYGPTPAFNHFNYGNAHPQMMSPPQPTEGDDGCPIQGQGHHQLSNEA